MKILGGLVIVVVLAAGVFALGDVVSQPPPPAKGACLLVRQTFLPDYCNNSCSPAFDCTASTRPYGLFFKQAATCDAAVIC